MFSKANITSDSQDFPALLELQRFNHAGKEEADAF
jgi:hypothetical protein